MSVLISVLIAMMIIGALVAIETPNLLHAVISLGAAGFLLSIVFLFLCAPDLAITQIAVEVITLILLLRATIETELETETDARHTFGKVAIGAMLLVLVILSVRMFAEFPEFGQPVMERITDAPSNVYLEEGLEQTGAANIVTAVLLDFRAYDTLGEATVLFCAIMGAVSILRATSRKQPLDGDEEVEL